MFNNFYKITKSNTNTLAFNVNAYYYSQKQVVKIHRIYVKNYPKYLSNIRLLDMISTYKKRILNSVYQDINIYQLLYTINLCGFFNYTQGLNIDKNSPKYILLDLQTNTIVKSIIVIPSTTTKLLIPRRLILNEFNKQLGLPKNYYLIYRTIKSIRSWYQNNGFIWSDIRLLNGNSLNDICIKIDQGDIKRVKLKCQSSYKIHKNLIDQINFLVQKELNIHPGDVLNYNYLQKGIDKLKTYNIISNCHYRIEKNANGLLVILEYSLSNLLLVRYSKNQQSSENFFLICRKAVMYLMNLNNNIKPLYFYSTSGLQNSLSISNLLNYKKHLHIEYYTCIYKFFVRMHLNYSSIKESGKSFYFIKKWTTKLGIDCIYSILDLITFQIETKNLLNFNGYSKLKLFSSMLNQLCIFYVKPKFSVFHYIFSKICFLEVSSINCYFHYQINANGPLEHCIKYYNLWIYSILYIYIPNNITDCTHNFNFLNKQIHIKYNHIINIPNNLLNIWKHNFIFSSNIYMMIGNSKNLYCNLKNINNSLLKYISLLKVEYSISLIKYTWLYCFINTFTHQAINFSPLQNYFVFSSNTKYCRFFTNYLGLGIQLDSLIKFIPPVRLEFISNNISYNMLHIYTYYNIK